MEQLKRLLSVQALSEYLEVPVATLYRWRYLGEGPPGFRVGKHLRYRLGDVEAWVEEQLEEARRRHPSSRGGTF